MIAKCVDLGRVYTGMVSHGTVHRLAKICLAFTQGIKEPV